MTIIMADNANETGNRGLTEEGRVARMHQQHTEAPSHDGGFLLDEVGEVQQRTGAGGDLEENHDGDQRQDRQSPGVRDQRRHCT